MSGLRAAEELQALAQACAAPAAGELDAVVGRLGEVLPGLAFGRVLSRGGWHRIGGVVDRDYARVAEHIDAWAQAASAGDVGKLITAFGGAGYFATRWQGTTHYLTAPLGPGASAFVQLEIEELQEVLDRFLIDPDWYPDDLEEFIDPLDYPRLEPEPLGDVHFAFRRLVRVPDWLLERGDGGRADGGLPRLFFDWDASSAGASGHFCRHWALALRATDGAAAMRRSAKPIAALPADAPLPDPALRGAALANQLHLFDRCAGYPFAWYFHMLCTTRVSFEVGDAVLADLADGFDYLPERDVVVLRRWAADRYAP